MNNRVYYGEYSLKHWIDLMLKKNIILPKYQRKFVWEPEDVKRLIKSIKDQEFVPPVTIGQASINGENQNLIIDGQQRLTSLLLYFFNKYPKKDRFVIKDRDIAIENEEDDIDDIPSIDWKFEVLVSEYPEINNSNYDNLYNEEMSMDFLDNHYLGFAYIVPDSSSCEQSKYYSSVFKHINESGKKLSKEESRRALYFLDEQYTDFFDTKALDALAVQQQPERAVDFVRYAAMLAQYNKCNNYNKIAVKYGSSQRREDYYLEYINTIVEHRESELFGNFETIFPSDSYKERLERIKTLISNSLFPKKFPSIIDADYYLFGLLFFLLYKNNSILFSAELKKEIDTEIEKAKRGSAGAKRKQSPNALNYTQQRIKKSIEIYEKYVKSL